ncbi:phage shock protein PspD [Rosenbergiella australiborealis]|uniref:phage shock protein PspD n=1 Tax=Rosenbergiella australiborealis TaxID=1544696 RepID=UPI001F4E4AD2|nr:phage shock protein PspD [Rosenbergiella australiborealis]
MNKNWQNSAKKQVKPALKSVGKFVLLNAVTFGPAGVAGWAVKSVTKKPFKLFLGMVLEPLLSKVMKKISAKLLKVQNEKHPK